MSGDSTNLRQEFTTELESILESDEAYGSNVQILTYALKEDVINGKFKDSWNNRVYEFIIDVDGISYKPAAKLDSFNIDEAPVRFDSYSEGYLSLFVDTRSDGKLIGKRTKKPKCGNSAYGCGFSCIGIQKTCRISASGGKTGSAIGKERLNKLMTKVGGLYAEGNKGGATTASAAANKITDERNKKANQLREERKGRVRQPEVKTPVKPQEKQPAKPKPEPTKPTEKLKANSKSPTVDQEVFNTTFPPKEVQREYGQGGVIDRAKEVISFVQNPKAFNNLTSRDKAGFLDNITTIHGVGDKNHHETINLPAVQNDKGRKMGVEASNVRAQGAKQIWDNLTLNQKTELAKNLKDIKSKLAEKSIPGIVGTSNEFKNEYVNQLANEIRELIK